jgi:hypothetical protein
MLDSQLHELSVKLQKKVLEIESTLYQYEPDEHSYLQEWKYFLMNMRKKIFDICTHEFGTFDESEQALFQMCKDCGMTRIKTK